MPNGLEVVEALKTIKDIAELINSLQEIFDGGEMNEELNDLLRELQDLREAIRLGVNQILEALEQLAHDIDEDVAFDNMALADRALFSDLEVFGDKQAAMGNSYQAADRLVKELDIVFSSSFMYVVNIRLAVLKDFDPNFPCIEKFRNEVQAYIDRLNGWITQLNDSITQLHTVSSGLEIVYEGPPALYAWVATHFRGNVGVHSFMGALNNRSPLERQRVERQANDARREGIAADRENLGVVAMEGTQRAWAAMLGIQLRRALITQVLNRPVRAIDFNPDGLMVDGRIVPVGLDLRTTLVELLKSREFRRRIQRSWDAFVDQSGDALVQLAHRRLFDREATEDETAVLRRIAVQYGYGAFVAALVYSDEYEKRFGRGLPGGGRPIAEELEPRN